MTDESKTKRTGELVLDWDDALDSWEQEIDDSATAEAAPLPAQAEPQTTHLPGGNASLPPIDLASLVPPSPRTTAPPSLNTLRPSGDAPSAHGTSAPKALPELARGLPLSPRPETGRPRMYRPPDDDERRELEAKGARTLPPPAGSPSIPWIGDDDDEEVENTRIAEIPLELIETLTRADASERELASRTDTAQPAPLAETAIEPEAGREDARDTDPSGLDQDDDGPPTGKFSALPPAAPLATNGTPVATLTSEAPAIELSEEPLDDDELEISESEEELELLTEELSSEPPEPPALAAPATASAAPARPLVTEGSAIANLDELAPPLAPSSNPPGRPRSVPPHEDRGAVAALRTIRSRKRRVEHLPLAGSDDASKEARIALLTALSEHRPPHQAAELLLTAGELAEEVADSERARALYQEATDKAPALALPQQALARLALADGDVADCITLLEQQAAREIPARERARLWSSVARLRWLVLRDFAGALEAAKAAALAAPDERNYALLLARIELSAQPAEAQPTLARIAEQSEDPKLAALWWTAAGRGHELRDAAARAKDCYERAQTRVPHAFEANLALARLRLAAGQRPGAARALLATLPPLAGGTLTEALRRRAARLLGMDASGTAEALSVLEAQHDPASVRTGYDLASNLGDLAARERVVQTWIAASHGTERALAQLLLAELRAEQADSAECERALAGAAESDPNLPLVRVVREIVVKQHGVQLDGAAQGSSGLERAAQLAAVGGASSEELAALGRARSERVVPRCVDLLAFDASLEAQDRDGARAALESACREGAPEERVSALLALADYARRQGSADAAREALAEAAELEPRNLVVSRALARAEPDLEVRARLLRREAESATAARAAFLQLRVAASLEDAPEARLEALLSAYDAGAPSYAPAVWALHQEVRRQHDIVRLSELHAREASRAQDPHEAVAHLVRAALVRAGSDADAAAAQLTRALDLMPADPVLRELVIRLGDAVPATLRAEAIQGSAERATEPLRRAATLSAAAAFEDANQPTHAAALYEQVLREQPCDPIAEMGMERVSRAAGKAAELEAHRRRALSEATTPAARAKALEALLSLESGPDPDERLELARTLLQLVPDHPPALRLLERRAMEQNDLATLSDIERQMLETSRGERDRLARLRLLWTALLLRPPEKTAAQRFDELSFRASEGIASSLWLGRMLTGAGAARNRPDMLQRGTELLLGAVKDPSEHDALLVQQANMLAASDAPKAHALLSAVREGTPQHPTLLESLAESTLAMGDAARAVDYFKEAAQRALTPRRSARLYHRAGRLLQDQLGDPERARDALRRAAEADITYGDVQARLEQLLSGRNDLEALITLSETRLQAAPPGPGRRDLQRHLASLYDKRGDLEQALTTLRQALETAPEDLALLTDFAALLGRTDKHREHAEALVRIARISRDAEQLCDVFQRLGELYDVHMPDPRRAEAAYRRVLKLSPKSERALERLSELHRRNGQTDAAAECLEQLVQLSSEPEPKRERWFALARLREEAGDLRGAEDELEQIRRTWPTDLRVLRGVADFFRRVSAQTALVMHLNRAANDLRHAIETQPDDAALWGALVEVLHEKGRKDAATACAAAAHALRLTHEAIGAYAGARDIPALSNAAFSELLDDLVFPADLPPAVRILFRHGAEALNRSAPLDLRSLAGEKLERKHPLRGVASELAKAAGLGDAEVYVTAKLPYAFVPVSDAPLALLVGKTILGMLDPDEQRFLVARACKIARAQMSITCRVRPDEMGVLIAGLIRAQVPDYTPEGGDAGMLEEVARRVGKHLSRRSREELSSHAVELAGMPAVDGPRAYVLASTAGNRAALLATGSIGSGVRALTKLAGLAQAAPPSVQEISQIDEARDLLAFGISEAHFEARQRAGAER